MPRSDATLRVASTTPLSLPPAASEPGNPLLRFEYAKFVNMHSTEYIRLADTKAAILVTLLSANVLVLIQRAGGYIAKDVAPWRIALVLFACAFAVTSLGVAVNIIRPRIFRNAARGHIFWEDVSNQEKRAYAESLAGVSEREILLELGEHNHNLAGSAIRKYRWLRAAFGLAMASVVISATVIVLTSR